MIPKIDPQNANGLVAFFSVAPGEICHLTQPNQMERLQAVEGADAWEMLPGGRLRLKVNLARNDARVVYAPGKDESGSLASS